MGIGFIQDKLEIKFLILYIAARVTEPLTPEDMQDLTMCDDGIDYFDYAECLNDLVKTEHLRLTEEGRYAITDKGMKNSQICESSLPLSVRQRSDRNIAAYNKAALRPMHWPSGSSGSRSGCTPNSPVCCAVETTSERNHRAKKHRGTAAVLLRYFFFFLPASLGLPSMPMGGLPLIAR